MLTWLISLAAGLALSGHSLPFYCSEPLQTSPSDELRCLYIDRRGVMWIGTNAGLKSWDGYSLLPIPAEMGEQLPSKTILSITEDPGDHLWLGTTNGLARLDRREGTCRTWDSPVLARQSIYTLFTSSDGTVWIGTDDGLIRYDAAADSFTAYDAQHAWFAGADGEKVRPGPYSVKSIVEAPDGELFIGTWGSGLLRFDPKGDTFRVYPRFNEAGSAFSLLLDSRMRLWIGTWGQGLYLMDQPFSEDFAPIRCIASARQAPRNFTRLVEDNCGGVVWAGDIDGICLFSLDDPEGGFRTCLDTGGPHPQPIRYCSDIVADAWGNVWLGMLYDGIFHVRTQSSPFRAELLRTPDSEHPRSSVSTIYTEDGRHLWLGLLPYGIALQDRQTGETRYNRSIPGFSGIREEVFRASVSAIVRRQDGTVWIGTKGDGIIAATPGKPATLLTLDDSDFLYEDYITALFTDRHGYTWVGQRSGLSLVGPDGSGSRLPVRIDGRVLPRCDINGILQDRQGTYWVATESHGILRIEGTPGDPHDLQFFQYDRARGSYFQDQATACFESGDGTLWAISNGGLSRLDRIRNRFETAGRPYGIGDGRILAIGEDPERNLWLSTDSRLVCIRPVESPGSPQLRWFSREDGLGDILFSPNAIFRFGQDLFFGSRNGYFVYGGPAPEPDNKPPRISLTGLSVDGVPYASLPPEVQEIVSAQAPMFTRHITIPASAREFSLDFSLLSHMWLRQKSYAYRLRGFDRDWHYLYNDHTATFQNLPPGTYQFELRAASQSDRWQDMGYPVTIQVLPPWYKTWWARLLALLLLSGLVFLLVYWYIQQLKARQFRKMNQVLTNISHELLTPLAVISGSVEELQRSEVQAGTDFSVIHNNIKRISRMLRQILEIRKSDAGKLKLQVSEADLAAFVREECRNIRPMATQAGIRIETVLPESGLTAWFDPDKLDKILYNLLSNAIKYNREGGFVEVTLSKESTMARISVRDNGIGIPGSRMRHLYQRFHDGDYRKTGTTGTGLGLSLTRELVRLHHGDIHCDSREGAGTTFTIRLPIRQSAYAVSEIEPGPGTILPEAPDTVQRPGPPVTGDALPEYAMLIVEDNPDLMGLMARHLSGRFRVRTATNGVDALAIIEKEELDIVISDVMMPQMDGLELTRRIKESDGFAQLPVILLTALTGEEDQHSGFQAGADAYLTKPFKLKDLEVRIDSIIRNRERIRKSFRRQTDLPGTGQDASAAGSDFLQRATECVLAHLEDGDYDRETFAQDMCMSSSSLYNKLRAATGLNISGFVNSIRLKEACRIAREQHDISITELSERVGYNSPRYFAMCFKKEFGISPREFMDRLA